MTSSTFFWFFFYGITSSMLLCVCSVIDHRLCQNVVRTNTCHLFVMFATKNKQRKPPNSLQARQMGLVSRTWSQ